MFGWVYGPVLTQLVERWGADANYSHGYVIVPVAAWFVYERRKALASAPIVPSAGGAAVLVLALLLLIAGVNGAEWFLSRVSVVVFLAGAVLFVCGRAVLRILAFPLAFLLLMIPPPTVVFNQVTLPLQLFASRVGERVLDVAGVPALREGNVLVLPYTNLEVVEACSGIRSIVSLLTLGIIFVQFTSLPRGRRWLVVASTVPLAVLANGLRVAGTGVAAYYWGSGAAEGVLHTFSGWLMFALTFAALLALSRALEALPPTPRLRHAGVAE